MHPELMFVQDVKVLYNSILSDENSLVSLKIQVLKNLQTYLQEEDSRMQEADRECECSLCLIHTEDASCVVQPYINLIFDFKFREKAIQAGGSERNG